MIDLLLAILHHLFVFGLVAIVASELVLVRPGIGAGQIRRITTIDSLYGVFAGLIVAVGFARVFYGAKGADFFLGNPWFRAKMAAFVVVGVLSVLPTVRFIGWRRQLRQDPAFTPADAEVKTIRRIMHVEATVLILIPVFAAAMVRPDAF